MSLILWPVGLPFTKADLLEQRAGPRIALGACYAGEHHRQRDVLDGGHGRDQVERLEDHADVHPAMRSQILPRHLSQVLVEDLQAPAGWVIEARDEVEEGGLAGP